MSAPPHADPGWGVFETMLVIAGRAVELDAHIARLGASVATLYGGALPAEARSLATDRAAALEHGKLRLAYVPPRNRARGGANLPSPELRADAEEIEPAAVFPGPERSVALHAATVRGGLGEHKWADRRLLDQATASAPAGALPLLLDADGAVLEASRGSVFAIDGDRVATPAADGRILPSIARRQAIEVAIAAGVDIREESLNLADLRHAEVFLTGSVRGVEPVDSLGGAVLSPPGEISAQIAAGLRDRWRVPATGPFAAAAGEQRDGRPER
jgi:para-aminobenzoate synthetase / 4-amino-4-deoxychorismate lyase